MTLVLGGIRSGKSQYAEQIAAGFGKKILYVATAEVWPGAGSMEYRVRKHQERRPKSWLTLECPRHVASAVGTGPWRPRSQRRYNSWRRRG